MSDAPQGWTAIRTYTDTAAAYIGRGVLESEGIPAQLTGTVMASVYPMTDTWAPVTLLVPTAMAADAERLLSQRHDAPQF